MPIQPTWDDLGMFTDPADFGVAATITLASAQPRVVNGIFDDPAKDAQLGEFRGQTIDPTFTAAAADLVGVKRGDVISIHGAGGGLFDVLAPPHGDGTGMAVLTLSPQ